MQVNYIIRDIQKLYIILVYLFVLISCNKETTKSTNSSKQETQWCYRTEPCWVIKNGYCTNDPNCVPNTKSLQQIEEIKDQTTENNIKRGECCSGCSVGGTKNVKYECGK